MHLTAEWIPLADGVSLHASVYLPAAPQAELGDAEDGPWPGLLEALPYRKDDITFSYRTDYLRLAEEGRYAVVRVDLRGTGSSGGIATDEYPETEVDDLTQVIAWMAAQPWCSGRVGMFGMSYSGFNALHLAAAAPPALGAVCAAYATDDRYTDDVHYAGGVLRAIDLIDYVHYMVPMNALPPVPAIWGDGWQDEWRRRIDETPPWLMRWLADQTAVPEWRRGSLRLGPDSVGYERITCPTMLIAGWADGYRNNTFRTVQALEGRVPWRLLAGPWGHQSPERARPGPPVDDVVEMIGWFDEHLRGRPPARAEPMQLFVRHSTPPEPDLALMGGLWRSEPSWPPEGLRLQERVPERCGTEELVVVGDVGTAAWISCAGGLPWGQPLDQRLDNARSLTCDWPPEEQPLALAGNAVVHLRVRSSAPVAHLSAKLCDVFPDGTSALIARGILNLTHRRCWPAAPGGEPGRAPEPLVPGEWTDVTFELEATSWMLQAGQRLRLALAGSDWPNTWPPPTPLTLAIDWSSLRLVLPVLTVTPPSRPAPVFALPQVAPAAGVNREDDEADGEAANVAGGEVVWRIEHDVLGRQTRAVTSYGGEYEGAESVHVLDRYEGVVGVSTVDPGLAFAEGDVRFRLDWPEASVDVRSHLRVDSDATTYRVRLNLVATLDDEPFAERHWDQVFERQLC